MLHIHNWCETLLNGAVRREGVEVDLDIEIMGIKQILGRLILLLLLSILGTVLVLGLLLGLRFKSGVLKLKEIIPIDLLIWYLSMGERGNPLGGGGGIFQNKCSALNPIYASNTFWP